MKTQTLVSQIGVVVSAALVVGCAPAGFQSTSSTLGGSSKSDTNVVEDRCVPDATDYLWDINIYGFSLSGIDFNVGYNGPVAGPITSIAVGVKVDSGTLNLQMSSKKPYDTAVRSIPSDVSMTTDFNFAVDIGIAKFGVGSNTDAQGSMIKLTKKGYQKLLSNASDQLKKDPTWSTHITKQLDANRFVVPVGLIGGMVNGDRFNVYKYQYEFADPAAGCSSGIVGGSKLSSVPVAELVVLDAHDGYAVLSPTSPTTSIQVNDLIEIKTLYKVKSSDKRALKKAVRIVGLHQPNHIAVQGVPIDLTSYLTYQMPSLMNDTNYWLVP